MGSTLSAPWAYLQKQGWPWIGIPASLEILRSWSVKFLCPGGEAVSPKPFCTAALPRTPATEQGAGTRSWSAAAQDRDGDIASLRLAVLQHPARARRGKRKTNTC